MRSSLSILAGVAALSLAASNSQAASGIFDSFIILNANGGGNVYYDLGSTTGNPDFQGANLGTYNPTLGQSLLLDGGQLKTYQDNGSNVSSAELNYRVYSGSPSGVFANIPLPFQGQSGNDKTWQETNLGTNLLGTLANGTYTLDVYGRAVSSDGDLYVSNNGANYQATFTIVPEPASLGLIGLGALAMLRRRSR